MTLDTTWEIFGREISKRISSTPWNTFSSQFSRQNHLAMNAEMHHVASHYQLAHALLLQETPWSRGLLCKRGHLGTGTWTCVLVPSAAPRPQAPKALRAVPLSENMLTFQYKASSGFPNTCWLLPQLRLITALPCSLNSCQLTFMGLFWIAGVWGAGCALPGTTSPPGLQAGKNSDFGPSFLAGRISSGQAAAKCLCT